MAILKKDSLYTTENLQKLFPRNKKDISNAELLTIRRSMDNPEFNGYSLVDTLLDNQDVMQTFKCSFMQYIQAVKFCAFTMGGAVSAVDAYIKTFQHRDFVKERVILEKSSAKYKELISSASRYTNSPLVQEITKRDAAYIYLKYRKQLHEAFMVLADEMVNAPLAKDRIQAADRFIVHAKPPESLKIEGTINHTGINNPQTILMEQLANLAIDQKKLLESGGALTDVQKIGISLNDIIDVEVDGE